jgi:two-component system, LytTR family, sensor histidine kinase AlgZ
MCCKSRIGTAGCLFPRHLQGDRKAMASINQRLHHDALPDFRNLGVTLRIVLIALLLCGFAALCRAPSVDLLLHSFLEALALAQPVLVLTLLGLWAANAWLRKLSYARGIALVMLLVLVLVTLVHRLAQHYLALEIEGGLIQHWLLAGVSGAAILYYFHLRSRALSPALTEARLQALQARIRPHFLFNSINAVLSLVRAEPRRAEVALEDMADLFRVLMQDNRSLSTLVREVELTRQYLNLEQLRLGHRLRVEWHTDNMPGEAMIPPLVLQPLVENAVYHGIEPSSEPGVISIHAYRSRQEVHLVLRNPYRRDGNHHGGNKMALANIRERLSLHFDAEAALQTKVTDSAYEVHIVLPYRAETR